jgi:hypothetical protein
VVAEVGVEAARLLEAEMEATQIHAHGPAQQRGPAVKEAASRRSRRRWSSSAPAVRESAWRVADASSIR